MHRPLIGLLLLASAVAAGPDAEGNPAGMRAYVFSCDDCSDTSTHFVAYVERYTPEAKVKLTQMRDNPESLSEEDMYFDYEQGRLIMVPDKTSWLEANSEEAFVAQEGLMAHCPPGSRIRSCYPGR